MTAVAIVTDSTSDLPASLLTKAGVAAVPLTVTIDGHSYLDGVEITAAEFYTKLEHSQGSTSTSQPSPGRFVQAYEEALQHHETVVSIHLSGRLSGTVGSAQRAAEMVSEDRIRIVDSENVSMALGLLVLMASTLASRGASADEVVAMLEQHRSSARTFCTVATLDYLKRGGRIGRASALLGSMLQIKPILTLQEGLVVPLEKVRTYERAMLRLVDLARGVDTGGGLCVAIGHAAHPEAATRLAEEIKGECESLMIQPLGPVVGAHTGPGTVGIGCYPASIFPLGMGSSQDGSGDG